MIWRACKMRTALLVVALGVVALLTACGSSSSTAPSQQSGTEAMSAGAAKPPPASGSGAARGAGSKSSGSRSSAAPPLTRASAAAAEHRAERREQMARHKLTRKAGKAAPFLASHGDNSIPTYGSEASSGESAAAEAVLARYLSARAAGRWGLACAQMSAQLQRQLGFLPGKAGGGGSCPHAYSKLVAHGSAGERTDPLVRGLSALRVKRPHAFALFYGPGSQQYMMPMVQEGGAWRVNELTALRWPILSPGN